MGNGVERMHEEYRQVARRDKPSRDTVSQLNQPLRTDLAELTESLKKQTGWPAFAGRGQPVFLVVLRSGPTETGRSRRRL